MKNYTTSTLFTDGKAYKHIAYTSGASVNIPINKDGSIKWYDDNKLLKQRQL